MLQTRGPSGDRLVFLVPNESQTQKECIMDVVHHMSGLFAIVFLLLVYLFTAPGVSMWPLIGTEQGTVTPVA